MARAFARDGYGIIAEMQDEPELDVRRYRTYMAALLFVVASIVVGSITRLFDKRDEWHIADSLSGLLIFLALLTIVLGELLLPPEHSTTTSDDSKTAPDK